MPTYETRDEIPEQYRWDLSSVYESDEAFLAALEAAQAYPEQYASYQGKISVSAAELLAFMDMDTAADVELGKLITYAERKSDEDTRESRYQDYSSQVITLLVGVSQAASWFNAELLSVSDETMAHFYEQEPGLELYRRKFDALFKMREHVLSPAEEHLLAGAGEMASQPGTIFSLLNDADLTFAPALNAHGVEHPVTHGSYTTLMMSSDATLRKNAYTSMYATYGQFRNTFAATLAAQQKQLKFFADARKYESALEAALAGNEVPTQVYTNLLEAVHANMEPMYKYVDLRTKLLNVDELHFYDLYVPVVEDVDLTFTYEQACDLILAALEPMGEEYCAIVRKGLKARWVDVYETPGKRSGAYSAGGYGMHPVILMSFQGKLEDVYTLIHEMGHSIHTYYSCENQPACYSNYVIFVAEVASTVNETLLTRYLLEHAKTPAHRAYFLNHFLEQFRSTLYRQAMFAEFELQISELAATGAGLTPDVLCDIYAQLNREYYGPNIVVDEQIALEWARIPHFYYQFYVYQYSTGFAAAIALANRILSGEAEKLDAYLNFLKGGSSKPPLELLKGAGVDMATAAPIESALAEFDRCIDELAQTCKALAASK